MTVVTADELRQAVLEELKALGFEWHNGELAPPSGLTKDLACASSRLAAEKRSSLSPFLCGGGRGDSRENKACIGRG